MLAVIDRILMRITLKEIERQKAHLAAERKAYHERLAQLFAEGMA